MRQNRIVNFNDINPKDYAYFAIVLMTLHIHKWEGSSITNGELELSRFVEGSDDYYEFAPEAKNNWTKNDDVEFWKTIGQMFPSKKQ